MSDGSIRHRISDLVQEEHKLRDRLSSHGISPTEEQIRAFVSGMTDRFALSYAERL